MDQGDIGFIFPNIIHHYQVFSCQHNQAIYLNASPFLVDRFTDILENKAPKPPVIKAFSIEPDVYHAFNSILGAQKDDITLVQAYLQIILARCIPKFQLVEKGSVGSTDLIYRTVSYVSGNFKHSITLESMARNLGVSKYVLSRIFSKTFHKNFNQYLNDARLGYACQRLKIPMIQSRSSALTVDLKVCAPLTVRLRKSSKLPPVNTGKHLLEIGI